MGETMNEPEICEYCGCEDHNLSKVLDTDTNEWLYYCADCLEDYQSKL